MAKKHLLSDDFTITDEPRYAQRQGYNAMGEKLQSAYIPHDPVDTHNDEPSLTVQEYAPDCDINNLMAQYERTGLLPHMANGEPRYVDFTNVPDLREALHHLDDATRAFMSLPAIVRKEFDNDPKIFVDFASDPENVPQMRTWGLAPPEPTTPPPQRVEIVNPPPPDPAK